VLIQKASLYNDGEISLTKFFDKKIGRTPNMKCVEHFAWGILRKNQNAK
jgi:hypothetical protein